jgi:hypothetical protein
MPLVAKQFVHWTPRVLGILLTTLVGLFALDVFGEGRGPWETFLAFLIHLLPAALVLLAVAVAWRWALAGGILFAGLGVLYLVMAWGKVHWSAIALLSGLPFLLAALFFLDWLYATERKAHS